MHIDRLLTALFLSTTALLTACGGAERPARGLDITPTSRLLPEPLPTGVAETALVLTSSGSDGSASAQTNLVWIVATEAREYQYAIAACRDLQLGEGEGDTLATARCDDQRYEVVRESGRLELRRDGEVLASLSLPTGWRVRVVSGPR